MTTAPLLTRLRKYSTAAIVRMVIDRLRERGGRVLSTLWFHLAARMHNVVCGRNLDIYGMPVLRSPVGRIVLGDRVQLISSTWRAGAFGIAGRVRLRTVFPSAEILFGEGSGMTGGSITARSKSIRIGRNTMIGPDCLITDSDFHVAWPVEARDECPVENDLPVTIGDNVWFGARCIVLKGVTIGENSVIAAGSVVVTDIPPSSLAGGNPARVLKTYA